MASDSFSFKQFTLRHDRCAMKVGTDGVLLGSWAELPSSGRVLDIGSGSGLLSLMAAQRAPQCLVTGIDIDHESVLQARENVASSPFASRVEIRLQDILTFQSAAPFHAILCNPPFYTEDTLPPDPSRAAARNASLLPLDKLVRKASEILTPEGSFSVVLPTVLMQDFVALSLSCGLMLSRRLYVKTVERKAPKRVLLTFRKSEVYECVEDSLVLMRDGQRSAEYAFLCRDFYL